MAWTKHWMFWICRQEDNNYAANGVGKLSHFFYCTNGREQDNIHLETARRKVSLKSVSKAQKSPREMLSTNALQVLPNTLKCKCGLSKKRCMAACNHRCREVWRKWVNYFTRHMPKRSIQPQNWSRYEQLTAIIYQGKLQVWTPNSNNISEETKCKILIRTSWINIPSKLDGIRCCYILVGRRYSQYNTIRL